MLTAAHATTHYANWRKSNPGFENTTGQKFPKDAHKVSARALAQANKHYRFGVALPKPTQKKKGVSWKRKEIKINDNFFDMLWGSSSNKEVEGAFERERKVMVREVWEAQHQVRVDLNRDLEDIQKLFEAAFAKIADNQEAVEAISADIATNLLSDKRLRSVFKNVMKGTPEHPGLLKDPEFVAMLKEALKE